MQKFLVILLTVFLTTMAQGDPAVTRDYYDALQDGLSVEDLEKLTPLDADQKNMAGKILEFYLGGPQSKLVQCYSNLKNSGTATEMWSADNDGKYPSSLKPLSPSYLYTAVSCPTSGNKPYEYSLSNGVYTFKCPGDHRELGVSPPTYNGESGLNYTEAKSPKWKFVSYTVEELTDKYAIVGSRINESWTWGDKTYDYRSQIVLGSNDTTAIARCWDLTDQDVSTHDSKDVLKLMDANFREDSLVSDSQLHEVLWEMSPAAVGAIIVEYLKNPEFADSRKRLSKALESND